MRPYDKVIQRLRKGEVVYLLSKGHSTAITCIPDSTHYKAKHKGGSEYDIESSTELVCDALEDIEELTELEYLTY